MPSIVTILIALSVGPAEEPRVTAADLNRFPPLSVCQERVEFASAHVHWCYNSSEAAACPDIAAWRTEADRCFNAWHNLRAAHLGKADETWLGYTRHLEALRRNIGKAAWWAGEMPPHVPLRHFRWR